MYEYQLVFLKKGRFNSSTGWRNAEEIKELILCRIPDMRDAFDFDEMQVRERQVLPHTVLTVSDFLENN